jgi:hypothetical protein
MRSRRFLLALGVFVLLFAGASYAWTYTPSYSLYRIRQALMTHDYPMFSHYVDVESVLDHAMDELVEGKSTDGEESPPRGALGKLFKKGILKNFAHNAREIMKAGLEITLEQVVKDTRRPLPEIPAFAVVAALWHGQADDDTVSFPVKVKKGGEIEIKTRQAPDGLWRVVEITNLRALLPALKRSRANEEERVEG